jgi:hypothetical protein
MHVQHKIERQKKTPKQQAHLKVEPQHDLHASARSALHPIDLLHLQNTIGNIALQRMLGDQRIQRDPVEEGAPAPDDAEVKPLTPGQVVKAQSYYAIRAKQYTPDIIMQIQLQVGADPTGTMDEDSVQAVARFQATHPPLKVDGMAGPRTLPAAFPSGLADSERTDEFVEAAQGVQADWATLDSADERAEALMEAVNDQLEDSKVPECDFTVEKLGEGTVGQFDFETWNIQLGEEAFEKETITNEEAADMANTVYHEARHAEQWYMMAQMLAGQGKKAAKIVTMMGIPAEIAKEAEDNPLESTSIEALIADGWYQSVYGTSAAYRNKVLTDLEKTDEALAKAEQAFVDDPSEQNRRKLVLLREKRQKLYEQYHNLPEEDDAHRVGDKVTERMQELEEE